MKIIYNSLSIDFLSYRYTVSNEPQEIPKYPPEKRAWIQNFFSIGKSMRLKQWELDGLVHAYYHKYTSNQRIGTRKDQISHMDHQHHRDQQDPLRYSRSVLVMAMVAIKQNESIGGEDEQFNSKIRRETVPAR